jgi:hypothetical protein
MSATTPPPNRRQRRLAAKRSRGEKPMSREPSSKAEAIDKLRAQIQPDQYLKSLEAMKATYLERASELLGNRDLNAASAAIDERDVEMVNLQLDEALADLSWRVDTINERIKDFEATQKNVTRPFERQEKPDVLEEMPEETEVEPSALTEEQAAAVDEARAAMAQEGQAGPPPESLDDARDRLAELAAENEQAEQAYDEMKAADHVDEAREAVAGTIEAASNDRPEA